MNRRDIILAQLAASPSPLSSVPAPVADSIAPVGPTSMFAVYNGLASVQPSQRSYTQMADVTHFLGTLVPSGPDQTELSVLNARAQIMGVGQSDQVRLSTLNVGPAGEPGLVQIVRLR